MRADRRLLGAAVALLGLLTTGGAQAQAPAACRAGTLYLTIDTGWGREAEQIAAILQRRGVRATLFVANEPTHTGERSLAPAWAAFWRARAAEGHVFASHTDRHWYFRGDAGPGRTRYVSRTREGEEILDQAAMCRELARPIERLREAVPDAVVLPLWRGGGGVNNTRTGGGGADPRPARWPWAPPAACATRAGPRMASSATSCPATRTPMPRWRAGRWRPSATGRCW
jgi:peptidoglycan/xylan/chitin deacetylase (PgdA/CDA1 family)